MDSWKRLSDLGRNQRSKYFNGETITGFEVMHVPGRDFAADVVTGIGGRFYEFKSWSSNLMGQSNIIDQNDKYYVCDQ